MSMTFAYQRQLDDGRFIEVWLATYGKGRILLTDGRTVDDLW